MLGLLVCVTVYPVDAISQGSTTGIAPPLSHSVGMQRTDRVPPLGPPAAPGTGVGLPPLQGSGGQPTGRG
jgi:hypothetical protein